MVEARCKLCSSSFRSMIIGNEMDIAADIGSQLTVHINKIHNGRMLQIVNNGRVFNGLMVMLCFDIDDVSFKDNIENMRTKLCEMVMEGSEEVDKLNEKVDGVENINKLEELEELEDLEKETETMPEQDDEVVVVCPHCKEEHSIVKCVGCDGEIEACDIVGDADLGEDDEEEEEDEDDEGAGEGSGDSKEPLV